MRERESARMYVCVCVWGRVSLRSPVRRTRAESSAREAEGKLMSCEKLPRSGPVGDGYYEVGEFGEGVREMLWVGGVVVRRRGHAWIYIYVAG